MTGKINEGACTATNLKQKLINCAPATHVRTLSSKKGWAHSISIISANDSGVTFTDCNHIGRCQVRYTTMTWDKLATFLKGYGGIEFAYSWKAAVPTEPPTTANLSVDKTDFKIGEEFTLTLSSDISCNFYLSIYDADSGELIIGEDV